MTTMRETVWLGTMEILNYEWTVVADSKKAAEKALRDKYRAEKKRGVVEGYAESIGEDPLEYHGASFTEMTIGKVEWL